MKVFVFSDLDSFEAWLTDENLSYLYIWNHSWVFIEDKINKDALYGYHFKDNDQYRKWRDELGKSDLVAFDIEHLFLVDKASDLTKLLLVEA